MRCRHLLAMVVALASLCVQAHADSVTYTDKATFLGATGAASATDALPNAGLKTTPFTVGSVTFSGGTGTSGLHFGTASVTGLGILDWTTRLPGSDLAINGPENLNVDLSGLVFSLGFDFVEPQTDPHLNPSGTTPFIDSTFLVTLKSGGTTVDSFSFNRPSDVASFVGVWSSVAFNRVEISETTGGAENEFFGQFYTGTASRPATPVSEPGALVLLLSGLAMSAGVSLRTSKRSR